MPSVKAPSQVAMKISVMKTGTKMKEDGIMKTRLFISIVIVWGLIGCTRNQEIDIPDANLSLFARTESPADTKTVVEEGVHVFWEPGDEIAVFMGEKSAKFTTDLTAASGTATFKGTFGDESWPEDLNLWAVYPYSEEATFDGETITTVLPSEQVAREGSFGKDMNLSIAHSTSSSLQFYNVGGGIRFSVTEEGIKKVMFEGLSGEIISGKVKIGFDENGKPVVKEVTGGSQFITLLPPSGKETFEPGAWYYIVAIPGSLEGGYKLRFYKDSDYARKVSEKAVEIKRSIFGNIEKADDGIEYEAQTMHFPNTEEDWVKSEETTHQISEEIDRILYSDSESRNDLIDEIIVQVQNVENVLAAKINSTGTGFGVMQKDSLWLNYLLDTKTSLSVEGREPILSVHNQERMTSKAFLPGGSSFYYSSEDEYVVNSKKKAVILAPFQHTFNEDLAGLSSCLLRSGFLEENIKTYVDREVVLTYMKGDFLCENDFILITTHGGTFYYIRNDEDFEEVSDVTALMTYVPYSGPLADSFIANGFINEEDLAICFVDDNHDGKSEPYFSMTPRFLSDVSFDNSCVFLCACHSAEILDENNPGSMVWRFLNQGAEFVAGNNNTTNSATDIPCVKQVLELASRGFSLQDASSCIKNSRSTKEFCDGWFNYYHSVNPENYPEEERFTFEYYNLYEYRSSPKLQSAPYFFIEPFSKLEEPEFEDSMVSFGWSRPISTFELTWKHADPVEYVYYYSKDLYTVNYDVYVDGVRIDEGINLEDNTCLWTTPTVNDHSWFVVTKIRQNGSLVGEYQSETKDFTITEEIKYETPEAIDLGLSVKWASFNLGATKPEEYGQYFAWGETATKDEYSWETYQWYDGDENHLTKYNATDQATLLNMDDDVVQQKLKGMWRVPSVGEWQELMEQCTWNWTTRDGVAGYDVTSNLNGKFIFIPAAGYKIGNSIADSSIFGRYWLGTCYIEYMPDSAASGLIKSDIISWISSPRYMGLPIRPVMPIPVESVSLDKTSLQIPIGSKATLTAIILPENATVKDVIWSSSNPSIATVGSITGEITGIAAGSTVITATTVDGHFSAQCPVQVVVPVTGITLDKNTMTISEGETQALMATVLPDNAYNKEVVWSSSNQAVATVTGDGKVTGVSAGSAVITATTSDGNKKATCRITVIKPIPINEIILSKNTLSMIVGESFTLTATILPSNATETDLSWKVDDSSVATVTDGKVTALKKGVTKVRAFHSYSSGLIVEGVCDVTVKDKSGSHEGTEEEGWQ